MSEKINSQNTPEQSEVTPEHQRAFRGIYSHIMKVASQRGKPSMITEDLGHGFRTAGKDVIDARGEVFEESSKNCPIEVTDSEGKTHVGWVSVLSEHASHNYGKLARLEIYGVDSGTHPADLYTLYPNQTIRHHKRTSENDGYYDDGEEINWRERIDDLGLLDTSQMVDLQLELETVKSRI